MDKIYDQSRHELVTDDAWVPDVVRQEILSIVRDFENALQSNGGWPTHPLDDAKLQPKWALYSGAAGAVVSLRILRHGGYANHDHSDLLPKIHSSYLTSPDYGYETGLQLGEIGILTPMVLADPQNRAITGRLIECMRKTAGNQAREITSGATGMMHAALTLFQQSGALIWKDLYCEGAKSLWDTWMQNGESGEWLWNSHIFGAVRSYYGACHGIAGNAQAFLRGADFLPTEWIETIIQRSLDTLSLACVRNEAGANWPLSAETDPVGQKRLVQWCHGAPGVVTALLSF